MIFEMTISPLREFLKQWREYHLELAVVMIFIMTVPLEENFSNNDENITKNLLLLWYSTWQFPLKRISQTMMRISLRTCCCYDICHECSPFKRISQTMMRISLRTCCCYDICHDSSPWREFLKQWWEYHKENITKNLLLLWYLSWQFPF